MKAILNPIEKKEVIKRCYTGDYIEELEKTNNKFYQKVMNAYSVFKTEDNLFVILEIRKPEISKTIYHNNEYEAPAITEDSFIDYNFNINFNCIDFSENIFIEKSRKENDIYYLGNYRFTERRLTDEEKKVVEEVYEKYVEDYTLRLKRYYKKYSDKIYTYGYWANR